METNENEAKKVVDPKMMEMIAGAVIYQRYYLSLDLPTRKEFNILFAQEFNKPVDDKQPPLDISKEFNANASPAAIEAITSNGEPLKNGIEPEPYFDVIEGWKCLNGAGCRSTEYISGRDSLGNKFTKCVRCGDIQIIADEGKCNG